MPESVFSRFWDFVKPPPALNRPTDLKVIAQRRRQRKLIMITLGFFLAMGAAWAAFSYIQSAPQRAENEFQEGMKLMRPGKYPDAISHFTRTLSISHDRADAYLERGNAHRYLDEKDAALADFQAAADLNPNLVEAHNGIAIIANTRHDLRRALEELNKSIALQPNVEAYYQRGEVLEAQGEHTKAIEDFDKAIAQVRDSPYMYLARAMAKQNLGDLEGARQDRETAKEIERLW